MVVLLGIDLASLGGTAATAKQAATAFIASSWDLSFLVVHLQAYLASWGFGAGSSATAVAIEVEQSRRNSKAKCCYVGD